jgi:hypothetical protein
LVSGKHDASEEQAAAPQQIFEVAWLDQRPSPDNLARLHQDQLSRKRPPLSLQSVTDWIRAHAFAEPLQVLHALRAFTVASCILFALKAVELRKQLNCVSSTAARRKV